MKRTINLTASLRRISLILLAVGLAMGLSRGSNAAQAALTGLGVSQDRAVAFFTKPEYDVRFQNAEPALDYSRIVGSSPDQVFHAALVGSKADVVSGTAGVKLSNSRMRDAVTYLMAAALVFAPDWKDGNKWVFENLKTVASGQETSTFVGDRAVRLWSPKPDLVMLSVTRAPR